MSRAGTRKNGTRASAPRVSCHDSEAIATTMRTRRDDVADDAGEHRREGLLGADDVVAQPGDEGAGLGAGEERDRLAQHVGEDLGAQVVDQALTDACGEPPLDQGEGAADDRDDGDEQRQADDDRGVLGVMPSSMRDFRISGVATTSTDSMTTSPRNQAICTL